MSFDLGLKELSKEEQQKVTNYNTFVEKQNQFNKLIFKTNYGQNGNNVVRLRSLAIHYKQSNKLNS